MELRRYVLSIRGLLCGSAYFLGSSPGARPRGLLGWTASVAAAIHEHEGASRVFRPRKTREKTVALVNRRQRTDRS